MFLWLYVSETVRSACSNFLPASFGWEDSFIPVSLFTRTVYKRMGNFRDQPVLCANGLFACLRKSDQFISPICPSFEVQTC